MVMNGLKQKLNISISLLAIKYFRYLVYKMPIKLIMTDKQIIFFP